MTPPLPIRYVTLVGVAVLLLGTAATMLKRMRRKTPEELEAERRDYLNLHGRIIDGTVLDYTEISHPEDPDAPVTQFLIYNYNVGGVEYEASQDVTSLRHLVDVHGCRIGLPASVRYDPHTPENSMVVSEAWTGLRSGIISSVLAERSRFPVKKHSEPFGTADTQLLGQATPR